MYTFCPKGQNFYPFFDKNYGFSACAVNVFFPTLLAFLALLRIVIVRPWSFKTSKLVFANESKFPVLYKVFIWLKILYPLNYALLVIVNLSITPKEFCWMWPALLVSCILAWWLASYALKCETFIALDRANSNEPKFSHSFLISLFWFVAFLFELTQLTKIVVGNGRFDWSESLDKVEIFLLAFRILYIVVIMCIGFYGPGLPKNPRLNRRRSSDLESLVSDDENDLAIDDKNSTFKNILKKLKFLWPYMWPKNDPFLQLAIVLAFTNVVLDRFAKIAVPIFYSKIVTALSEKDLSQIPWHYLIIYGLIYFSTGTGFGGSGLLSNIRAFLWIKVQLYTSKKINVDIFQHMHSLSLRWHLGRKTGEVLGVIDRGNTSLTTLLQYVLFFVLPIFADIIIAIVYFAFAFNIFFGLMVFVCLVLYIIATVLISEWRTKFKREANKLDNASRTMGVDSLLNFETVKYHGAEQLEVDRYRRSIVAFQKESWKNSASMQVMNVVQILIIYLSLFGGCVLCAYYIVYKKQDVGSFVLFTTYMVQLYSPLNFFGTYYRLIQQSFIDLENLLNLFMEKVEVTDHKGCAALSIEGGEIKFDDVTFHYRPDQPILKNVSFKVPAGKTVAVVGPSGSGKSTLIRLVFRFYDIQGGCISIDGQDISKVTQHSLRKSIGVVPQDTVLFSDTIGYNIHYGRPDASEEEMKVAAERADIHERIIHTFPDGYETRVGEKGQKLSGGEKQRVAIARTILKAPKIILLDEATSALDTQTERNIQGALDDVSKDRTTLVVAHRLSTVVNADMIMVLKDGVIVERGTHQELIDTSGSIYSEMWNQQATVFGENEAYEGSKGV